MYHGMQWFKCDLQLQTPGDTLNWAQDDMASLSRTDIDSSVVAYLRRCHECSLDVIGVTDHNFLNPNYLEALRRLNSQVAQEMSRKPLVIFPGFEIEIRTGLGVHLLCLFDPTTIDLAIIDDIVTELELPRNKRIDGAGIVPSNSGFDKVLQLVQERYGGIVIAAHPLAESGLLSNRFLTEHFQREMFIDSRLLAMEVPKPVEELNIGWQRLICGGTDCAEEWRRKTPIATVMSSDAYRLYQSGDRGYIGKRHTWIKMSHPSVESLRQAFLDHESRIRLSLENPTLSERHGRIVSLDIKDVAFVADQKVYFSSNLNCVIGSRGAGKSSLLEYIRFCTNNSPDTHATSQVERIKQTLNPNSTLELKWRGSDGLEEDFRYSLASGSPAIVTANREVIDAEIIFKNMGIQIFSQRQLTGITNDVGSLLPLLESMNNTGELERLNSERRTIIGDIRERLQKKQVLDTKSAELRRVQQELSDLDRRWTATQSVSSFAENLQKANQAMTYIEKVQVSSQTVAQQVTDLADRLLNMEWPTNDYSNWPIPDFFSNVENALDNNLETLVNTLRRAADNYLSTINTEVLASKHLDEVAVAASTASAEFSRACTEQGISEDELANLRTVESGRQEKQSYQDALQKDISNLTQEISNLENLYDRLFRKWREQYEVLVATARSVTSSPFIMQEPNMDHSDTVRQFIDIVVTYCGDKRHFDQIWSAVVSDRRTRLGRNWEMLGQVLYRSFLERGTEHSPWELLDLWHESPDMRPAEIVGFWDDLEDFLIRNPQVFHELKITRVNDQVDFVLFRNDGSRAGSFQDGTLSDGQRNTVMLAVLLARGTGPIIIDQPEEELDSDFIYNELVPVLRTIKLQRQVIVATHNANLPVNGDAELVYALQTENGKGTHRADGGLDQLSVTKSVLDIMEGSAEAFRRRSEKYHF